METVLLVLIILLQILLGFWKVFFKSYGAEKGKNLATKEDISEITKLVESVKITFSKEIEELKVNLQFENTIKSSMYQEKKDAIVRLFESIQLWTQIIHYHLENSIESVTNNFDKEEKEIQSYEFKLNLAEAKAELYIDKDEFWDAYNEYKTAVDLFEASVMKMFVKLGESEFEEEHNSIYREEMKRSKDFDAKKVHLTWKFRDECYKEMFIP